MKILVVAPTLEGITATDLPEVAAGNEIYPLTGMVTVNHLESALKSNQVDAVHLMVHGAYGVLKLSDREISEEWLSLALGRQNHLKFVFLNACRSAGMAVRIHNDIGVPVVFHEAPIDSDLAVRLASEFYHNLGSGLGMQEAIDDANAAVARDARTKGVIFVPMHLVNGGAPTAMAAKLEYCFGTLTSQLKDIDTRLAYVETMVTKMARPRYLLLIAGMLALLVIEIGLMIAYGVTVTF